MHTVELKLDDSIYSNVMFLLNNLNLKGLEIKEKFDNKDTQSLLPTKSDVELFSNHSANLVEEWKDLSEDQVWN